RRRHRLLRRRGPARGGRRLRVRHARRHGRGARRDLRVSRSAVAPVDELEVKARVEDPDALRAALLRAGARLEFQGDMVDRRFDRYPDMDVLIEVEGEPAGIERAIAATGLGRASFLAESLPYFVAAFERRTGRAALLAR